MNTATCRDLLHTPITQYWSLNKQTAVCLQHMSDLYIIWFKEKKCFLECLCMNLNFKLFLFLFSFIKSTDLFWEKKLCKYLIYFISRKQKIYVWLRHKEQCFWLKRCIDWGSSTQIWISALWMYYSSVLNPVECSSARLFNLLRCHFFYYYLLYIFLIGPYF